MSAGRLLFAILAGLMTTACGDTHHVNYRMTLDVQTPEGLRSGSTVIEVKLRENSPFWEPLVDSWYAGEALVVELPGGETLFALPSSPYDSHVAVRRVFDAFAEEVEQADKETNRQPSERPNLSVRMRHLREAGHSAELRGEHRPFLVRFADPSNPASVEAVNPDKLSEAFGPGYSLADVRIVITEDPGTNQIEHKLPWLQEYRMNKWSLSRHSGTAAFVGQLASMLSPYSFSHRMEDY